MQRKTLHDFTLYMEENSKKDKITTGFFQLDKNLGGGLFPGLYVLGAVSSLGKTALTLQIADNIASKGKKVLFFSLEMNEFELMARSISRLSYISNPSDSKKLGTRNILFKDYDPEEEGIIIDSMGTYENAIYPNLFVIKKKLNEQTPNKIENTINKFIEKHKENPIVFIDYLQILQSDETKNLTDKQKLDSIIVALKNISTELDITIFVVSSFNRENYTKPVGYESFKETGCIEYTADVILGLQLSLLDSGTLKWEKTKQDLAIGDIRTRLEKEKGRNPREVSLHFLKQRNAKTGIKQKFLFYPKNNTFKELGGC